MFSCYILKTSECMPNGTFKSALGVSELYAFAMPACRTQGS